MIILSIIMLQYNDTTCKMIMMMIVTMVLLLTMIGQMSNCGGHGGDNNMIYVSYETVDSNDSGILILILVTVKQKCSY